MDKKLELLNRLKSKSKKEIEELVNVVLSKEVKELKPYVVDIIKYNNSLPTFKQVFGVFYSALEAIRFASEKEEIEESNGDDIESNLSGILKVTRIHGLDKKYTEKDMLNSWKFIMDNIKIREEEVSGIYTNFDNKGLLLDVLADKYNIRKNNFVCETYKRNRHRDFSQRI